MYLKKIRVLLAVLIFALLTFFFLDFGALLPEKTKILAEIQFFPALLSGSILVLGILILATLLLGRVYCSVICPMGIFQDIVAWFSKRSSRKKKYTFSREKKILRYSTLGLTILAFVAGGTVLLSLLEPYSAFGRMVTNVFKPVYLTGNNLLAELFNRMGNYSLYHQDIYILSVFSLVIGLITFLGIGFLAWKYGRTYCNTLCPVGTLLSFFARYSLLKVKINEESCNQCGLCAMKCKASCIDSKNSSIDYSRCVDCFDCLTVCKKNALTYGMASKKKTAKASVPTDDSKRRFLTVLGATALIAPARLYSKSLAKAKKQTAYTKKYPLSPPGSKAAEHLLIHCTACHLCVAKCPSHVLKPAFDEYGLGGIMQPRMDFEKGYCNYHCTHCSEVCPNGAIEPLTVDQKKTLQMGHVVFLKTNCVVYTDETNCGACSEHCPTQAVKMVPYKGSLTIPSVDPEICVGCGGCEHICPVRPYRAIYVEGNPVHLQAKPFEEAKQEHVQLDDFGF